MKAEYKGVTFEGTPEEIAAVLKAAGLTEQVTVIREIERVYPTYPTWPTVTWGSGEMDCSGYSIGWPVLNADASPPRAPSFSGVYSV